MRRAGAHPWPRMSTDPEQSGSPRRRTLAIAGVVGTALLVAVATAIGTGLGDRFLDLFGNDQKLVSHSENEEVNELRDATLRRT